MSSILEALKKLEDEKAARRSGTGNLAGKVAGAGRKPRTSPAWLIPGGMLAVAAVSILGTYALMSRAPSPRTAPARGETAPSPAGEPAVTRLPSVAAPVTDVLGSRRAAPRPEGRTPGHSVPPRKAAAAPKAPAKHAPPVSTNPGKSIPASPGKPLPELTVAGIAWQKDTALRLAIVNGIPVREGGVVNGVTVREILPDRVRFSVNGKNFDLPLGN
jgi:general secretion pathway protein B